MLPKYNFITILICLLYLYSVSGHRNKRDAEQKITLDELDRTTIEKTGCKILTLANGESKLFLSDSPDLNNTILSAYSTHYMKVTPRFEIHFAIRSDAEVQLILFSRRQYENSTTRMTPDFEFRFRKDFVNSDIFRASELGGYRLQEHEQRYTPQLLSADNYTKLFIKLNKNRLYYGKECEPFPIYSDRNYGRYHIDIAEFGFRSKSELPAKILYDCPASFADCKCNHVNRTKPLTWQDKEGNPY